MRAELKLKIDKNTVIPFNYQYHLSSMIYNSLNTSNPEYAAALHSYHKFKFFTFSWLDISDRIITPEGIRSRDGIIYLKITSPDDQFLSTFLDGFFQEPLLKIGHFEAVPSDVHIIEAPQSFSTLKTISPVCLRTREETDGKNKVKDLLPNSSKFYTNLKQNLTKKYELYYNIKCDMDFEIEILSAELKRVQIKDTFVRCSNLIFDIRGDDELIRFGYESGLGEKNSMGFGMIEEK
ncbi:MAG: CRISPR-associated endoribonuclease Cas6 [Methanosarcinales archaeon]|jgi:CRISPR-associated endoribonuclease Cas6|nr:CRISPR-associated endoribonuclease Cas6 [Methanosarcinales archaeon]